MLKNNKILQGLRLFLVGMILVAFTTLSLAANSKDLSPSQEKKSATASGNKSPKTKSPKTKSEIAGNAPEKGISFDGFKLFQVKNSNSIVSPNAFSLAVWVKLEEVERSQVFMNMGNAPNCFTLYLYRNKVRMLVEKKNIGGKPVYDYALADPPKAEKWTHYCGTYDGQTIHVYRNGILASKKKYVTELKKFDKPLLLGGLESNSLERAPLGVMEDAALWNRSLSDEEVLTVYRQSASAVPSGLIGNWKADGYDDKTGVISNQIAGNKTSVNKTSDNKIPGQYDAVSKVAKANDLLNQKDEGFRSIWYYNQKIQNEYNYKYSGGLGTYPANHYPFAVYCPKVDKTFFCFGGTDKENESTLYHEVSCYDHKTGMICRPTIIIDKKTDDAHDNPVMTVDDAGYLWIFSTSHGTGRPSWIHQSVRPYDCSEFKLVHPTKIRNGKTVPMNNFSYIQVFNVPGRGMVVFFTTYDKSLLHDPESISSRTICLMTSRDGVTWSDWQPLAAMMYGHYQNAAIYKDQKIGTSFNYHPNNVKERRIGLNWRTNLYYIESNDLGKTWHSVDGKPIAVPMKDSVSPALVYDYEKERLNVYIMDMIYDNQGYPIIFYITSKGFESGPENDPRIVKTARWTGSQWEIKDLCKVDNNYDFGSLYVEKDGSWTMIGALDDGPQKYNTGGEMSLWQTKDQGNHWTKARQMTKNSPKNHCYPRRPINASPEFYSIWADGNGREKSTADLYFANIKGDVFKLPRIMKNDWQKPEKVNGDFKQNHD